MTNPYIENIRSRVGHQCLLLPGVRAIILNDCNEVLLQRRMDVDYWGLPAGAVELDETALGALRREVMEETRLEVLHAEPMALYSGPSQRFSYPNGDEVQGFAIAFIVRQWAGEPKADGVEGSEVRFWPIDVLPHDMIAIHVQTLADLKQYKGHFIIAEK